MRVDPGPLTWDAAAATWHVDLLSAAVVAVLAAGYAWCYRRTRGAEPPVRAANAACFGAGMLVWLLATISALGALVHPATTSVAMLATPWLLYLTPWYTAALQTEWIGAPTRILLVALGFCYFYARLQEDPVPHRYPQSISLLISVAEALGDGVLGLVIWQGSLIGASYYAGLQRSWGPDPRLDQTIGAGVLWILGDLVGWPFVLLLMRAMSRDDKAHAVEVDAELDEAEARSAQTDGAESETSAPSGLWWENDPQLRERFRR